jgi:hypothetical protein
MLTPTINMTIKGSIHNFTRHNSAVFSPEIDNACPITESSQSTIKLRSTYLEACDVPRKSVGANYHDVYDDVSKGGFKVS